MKLKSLLIAGAVAAAFMAPEYATAHPKPRPPKPKPDLTDKMDDAKEHHEKVKGLHKQLKDASDEDKEGLREQLKNLRKDWFEGMKGNREEFKNKRDDVIDANEEDGDKPGE